METEPRDTPEPRTVHRRNLVHKAPQHRPKYKDDMLHPLINKLGINREQFGRLLGVTGPNITGWVSGRRRPRRVYKALIIRLQEVADSGDQMAIATLQALATAEHEDLTEIAYAAFSVLFHHTLGD